MKYLLPFSCFFLCLCLNVSAQKYEFRYMRTIDSAFKNYSTDTQTFVNAVQSIFRQVSMDSTIYNCWSDESGLFIEQTPPTEINRTHPTLFGGTDGEIKVKHFNNTYLGKFIDYRNLLAYTYTSDLSTPLFQKVNRVDSCAQIKLLKFGKTNQTKKINGIHANKWIPVEAALDSQVEVWICDSLPKTITPSLISNDFDGAIVRIQWKKGITLELMDYKQSLQQVVLGPFECMDNPPNYNLIHEVCNNGYLIEIKQNAY